MMQWSRCQMVGRVLSKAARVVMRDMWFIYEDSTVSETIPLHMGPRSDLGLVIDKNHLCTKKIKWNPVIKGHNKKLCTLWNVNLSDKDIPGHFAQLEDLKNTRKLPYHSKYYYNKKCWIWSTLLVVSTTAWRFYIKRPYVSRLQFNWRVVVFRASQFRLTHPELIPSLSLPTTAELSIPPSWFLLFANHAFIAIHSNWMVIVSRSAAAQVAYMSVGRDEPFAVCCLDKIAIYPDSITAGWIHRSLFW